MSVKRAEEMYTKTVLIVEDNTAVVASYMQILKCLGLDFISIAAPNYETAKKILSIECIDLIIMDLVLPDALATDKLQELRLEHPGTPIIIVTGHPELLDPDNVKQMKVENIFTKPFRAEALGRAIQSSFL